MSACSETGDATLSKDVPGAIKNHVRDTHDTTKFIGRELQSVEITVSPELAQRITLRLDQADREELARRARAKGVRLVLPPLFARGSRNGFARKRRPKHLLASPSATTTDYQPAQGSILERDFSCHVLLIDRAVDVPGFA